MTLSASFLCDGKLYPAETPLPAEIAKRVPPAVREAYEIKPGAKQPDKPRNVANFVPGVCYSVSTDGTPIRDEHTARDEEKALEVQRKLREVEWERSGLADPSQSKGTPMQKAKTRAAYAAQMENQ
jgi:hypothetical protein